MGFSHMILYISSCRDLSVQPTSHWRLHHEYSHCRRDLLVRLTMYRPFVVVWSSKFDRPS